MKTPKISLLLFSFLLLFLLVSCSKNNPGPQAVQLLPTSTAITEDLAPKAALGKGVVVGKIDMDDPQHRVGLLIYLGQLIRTEQGDGGMLDTNKAPSSPLRVEDGYFQFKDVEPGLYTLVIYEVGIGGKIYSNSDDEVVIVDVKPDEVLDLGNIPFALE